ncbi:MAG: tRNA (adenosine(37)-N6)-threonylcarbamoyltransferase complex dimerization subunit type 1 TsaB [Micromonosporaceae bacterium]
MYVLVVDTATPAVTAALVDLTDSDVTVAAVRTTINPRAHGELLTPSIDTVLAEAGAAPRGLTAIVAGVGPGPYTGLRVGLVTATAMGQALGVPTYGVCSLDGIGAASTAPGTVVAATDARRREIYWRGYESGAPITDPAVDRPDVVAERLPALGVGLVVGEGAHRYPDVLGVPVADQPLYPDPGTLARIAAERVRTAAPSEALTPLYLRRPDAVEPGARKPVLR